MMSQSKTSRCGFGHWLSSEALDFLKECLRMSEPYTPTDKRSEFNTYSLACAIEANNDYRKFFLPIHSVSMLSLYRRDIIT